MISIVFGFWLYPPVRELFFFEQTTKRTVPIPSSLVVCVVHGLSSGEGGERGRRNEEVDSKDSKVASFPC